MAESWRNLREVQERIRWARMHRTEFKRPTDAAKSLNERPGTYRNWEHRKADGGRAPNLTTLQKIARKFGVSWVWLLTGQGHPDDPPANPITGLMLDLNADLAEVEKTKREDAARAAQAVLAAFKRSA